MELTEIEQEIKEFLKERGWINFPPTDIFIHLIEELGELGKHILFQTGYKTIEMGHKKPKKEELKREFAQVFSLFIQLALSLGVNLEEAWNTEIRFMKKRFSTKTNK